jgi:hypothetical protein
MYTTKPSKSLKSEDGSCRPFGRSFREKNQNDSFKASWMTRGSQTEVTEQVLSI